MATKKNTSKSRKAKPRQKSSTTHKAGKPLVSKKLQEIMEQIPPVIVGGGGSVYIYLRGTPTLITPSPVPQYTCYRLNRNLRRLFVIDRANVEHRIELDPSNHIASFDE